LPRASLPHRALSARIVPTPGLLHFWLPGLLVCILHTAFCITPRRAVCRARALVARAGLHSHGSRTHCAAARTRIASFAGNRAVARDARLGLPAFFLCGSLCSRGIARLRSLLAHLALRTSAPRAAVLAALLRCRGSRRTRFFRTRGCVWDHSRLRWFLVAHACRHALVCLCAACLAPHAFTTHTWLRSHVHVRFRGLGCAHLSRTHAPGRARLHSAVLHGLQFYRFGLPRFAWLRTVPELGLHMFTSPRLFAVGWFGLCARLHTSAVCAFVRSTGFASAHCALASLLRLRLDLRFVRSVTFTG